MYILECSPWPPFTSHCWVFEHSFFNVVVKFETYNIKGFIYDRGASGNDFFFLSVILFVPFPLYPHVLDACRKLMAVRYNW
ncbi:uncharacterized protein BO72DRAFT_448741 [Aspergillus fijiensis CBS 313.89]|uniref:Uncharacterized protein n=1 Tax=Aspergillus fijiensis CBS 313.89 TaxID=1448319 RepID=A0A8G1RNE0_9EURO|nr:uncharacterized protein BO72DRAFT_448741 [Aspergillus fijiensis CBS 313.89]RAK76475.1 hypothetical protein BO72DRAFT_448741 [Aspergillus fijiensis CBS 313.89]